MITTHMVLAGLGNDFVQLFKSLEAQFGDRTVQVPYYLQAGVSTNVLAHLKDNVRIGDELDVVLDDSAPGRYAMRLVHYLTTDDGRRRTVGLWSAEVEG